MKLPQGEVNACLFHSERKQKSEEDGIGMAWVVVRKGLEGPAPKRDPIYTAPGTKGGLTSPRSTGTLDPPHCTVGETEAREGQGSTPGPQGSVGASFLPEAPTEPLLRAGCGVPLHSQ